MNWFEKIKGWYESGIWSIDMVQNAINMGKITQEQYKQILLIHNETKNEI